MDSYKNKMVLVTGASSGIGKAMAIDLAAAGAELILTARSHELLEALANQINKNGGQAHVFVADLAQAGSAETLHAQITEANLHVDILVNNAGYGRWGKFGEFTREDYADMIQLNITSLTDLCHLFMPAMVGKGEGGIINIGSSALSIAGVSSVILGIKNRIELKECLEAEAKGLLSDTEIKQIDDCLKN